MWFFICFFVLPIGWALYMMTCRTDDWLRLVKEDQERKAKRNERAMGLAKGIARLLKK
jgi:hypothetical protein